MAMHIHNLKQPTISPARGTSVGAIAEREMLLAAGWSEDSNNGDAAWANVVIATPADFAVSESLDNIITAPSAPFTQAMADDGDWIVLFSGNDNNRGIYNIIRFIDSQTVEVEATCAPPDGWTTESGISGRIVGVDDALLASGAWVLMDSPGAQCQLQARIKCENTTYIYSYARPRGKTFSGSGAGGDSISGTAPNMTLNVAAGPFFAGMVGLTVTIAGSTTPANDGTFTITGATATTLTYSNGGGVAEGWTGTWTVNGSVAETSFARTGLYYGYNARYNGYFDGNNALMYWFADSNDFCVQGFGELDDTDAQDYSPGFVLGSEDSGWNFDRYWYDQWWVIEMLDASDTAVAARWTMPKAFRDWAYDNDGQVYELMLGRRLVNGARALLRKPRVFLDDTVAGAAFPRGTFPDMIKWTNKWFEPFRPMDGAGAWQHLGGGMVVPRNGVNAPIPLIPA